MKTTEEDYHPNGKLWYKHNYFNGKYHGLCKAYYSNGQLNYNWNYSNGKYHGLHKAYHFDGQLWYQRFYLL